MKVAVSMWSLHRKFFHDGWTVLTFLEFCRNNDIQRVELLDLFWRDLPRELPEVQAFLMKNQMQVAAYAVGNDFVHSNPVKRNEALQSILVGIPVAKELGTDVIRVFAGDLKEGYDFASGLAYVVEGLKTAAKIAERHGIVLALENHGKLAGQGSQVREIIEQVNSNALGSTFDIGNFRLVDECPLTALEALLPHVKHVHVKDFRQNREGKGFSSTSGEFYSGMPCGAGEVPISDTLAAIGKAGYNGAISIEFEGEGDEIDGVLSSLRFLMQLGESTILRL